MKMMKKVATLLLAVCLIVPCFSMLTFAANQIMFEDPSTTVGETLGLKGVVSLDNNIEDRTIVMTYDTSMLKFKNGDNVTETASGKLTYNATGEVGGTRVEFMMYFDVLKEGTTKVEVESYTIYNTSDDPVTCAKGDSTIKIAAGDSPAVTTDEPTTDEPVADTATVEVNGVSYIFSDAFTEEDIPQGFVESTIDYDGAERKVVMNETSGLCLGYLVDANGEGKFFVYVSDNATFAPYETIDISDSVTIVLLTTVEDIVLPESYKAFNVTVNGTEFPAWQNIEDDRFCILYAMNNQGEKSLYQFDTEEDTYQRFDAPQVELEEEDTSLIGKLSDVLENHLDYVILGTGLGFILFVIIIIILSVKLYNRNAELDELYDEYGIDLDDEDGEKEEEQEVLDLNLDVDTIFANIDDETEDDVVMETTEDDSAEENDEEEDDSEVEVEFFVQEAVSDDKDITGDTEDVLGDTENVMEDTVVVETEDIAKAVEEDESFFDDDDEVDFEMDFIDLDD